MQLSQTRIQSRRKGQALILAVLVMLFAVLLSSAFLVVIGNSGRQVGRETDRSEAAANANKGVAFVISRLQAAKNPDRWSPDTDAVFVDPNDSTTAIPTSANADYNLYYSPLDRAMGWADQGYAKYPDPRKSRQAPEFLVSSHVLGTSPADDLDGGDKRFMLRITVIGLSSKNPDLWTRKVLYKTTNWNGGTFSYANFVTSFDPDTQKPVTSTIAQTPVAGTATGTIDVDVFASKGGGNERATVSPRIAEIGNTLMISDGRIDPVVGVVSASTASPLAGVNGYRLTLRVLKGLTNYSALQANAKISLVGSLFEAPSNIDENGDGNGVPAANEGPTTLQRILGVSGATDTSSAPLGNGAQFNEGLNVPLTTIFAARPPVTAYTGSSVYAGQNSLSSSGPLSVGDPTPVPAGGSVGINFVSAAAGPTSVLVQQPTQASTNQFLQVSYAPNGAPQVSTQNSVVAPAIVPRSVKPASIDMGFYRAQIKNGASESNNYYALKNHSDGAGIYLNNADDVEKFNGQPLTTGQLQRLWQRKSFAVASGGNVSTGQTGAIATGTNGARLCYGRPGPGGDSYIYPLKTGGLEARGIRGWISPWEFLPRGAQVILDGANQTVTVISDPLSDSSPNAPDLNKSFDPLGTTNRVFSKSFKLPVLPRNFTATDIVPTVICAEGNLRVSGNWNETGQPLTIVSGDNIYIEGDLKARDTLTNNVLSNKVALLAKKNIVVNPTQFVARPLGTVDTSVGANAFKGSASGGVVSVTSDINSFKVGDKVAVFAPNTKATGWRTISAINGNSLTIDGTAVADSTDLKLKLACDPPIVLLKDNPLSPAPGGGTPAADQFPTNELFVPSVSDPAKEADTQELDPTANGASAGNMYAYKFSVGGDTLARDVPFTDIGGNLANVGVAYAHAAEKKIITFAVQGGEDPNAQPPIVDDGKRTLQTRSSAYQLYITHKPGTATNPDQDQTFNLEQLTGSVDDSQSTLGYLNSQLVSDSAPSTTKENRWTIALPTPVPPATTGAQDNTAARHLSKVNLNTDLGQSPSDEGPTEQAKFRVPLTSSVLLFNGELGTASPTVSNPLLTIGSFFDYQNGSLPTTAGLTENDAFIDAAQQFYGYLPRWSIQSGTTYSNVANATRANSVIKPVVFTRDGEGDYTDQLPAYYISAMHFQRVDSNTNASVDATQSQPKTNMNVEVDATIYAEGGSWFIIPVPTPTANAGTPTDPAQKIEWRRPGYSITVNGNITQMMTPTATVDYDDEPDPDGVATGAMKRWTDSLAYQVSDGTKTTWQTIQYNAVPLPAFATDTMGAVQTDGAGRPIAAPVSQLPSSSDILYTYSN